jgi:hypothetical protein
MNPALNRKLLKAIKEIEATGQRYRDEPCVEFGSRYVHHVWDALHIIQKCQDWYSDLYYSGHPGSVRDKVFGRRFNFLGVICYFLKLAINNKDIKGDNIFLDRYEYKGDDLVVGIGTAEDSSILPCCEEIISEIYGTSYRRDYKGVNLVKFLTDYCSSTETINEEDGEEIVVFNLTKALTEFIDSVKKEQEANYKEYMG